MPSGSHAVAKRGSAKADAAAGRRVKGSTGGPVTPCPRCHAAIPITGTRGVCAACGLKVRFEEAQERPCVRCGQLVALAPSLEAARCEACGTWQATDATRQVEGRATCPRCRRRIPVPPEAREATCPRCSTRLILADTL